MKLSKLSIAVVALFAFAFSAAPVSKAQFGGVIGKVKDWQNESKIAAKTENDDGNSTRQTKADDDSETRAENARKLAKADGMPKAANTDAALNKLLFQAADDTRLIPRRVVVVDKDWLTTTGTRNAKVRRIFAVIGRTLDDGSGKCGKQMVQFDQDWKEDKNAWGLIYVQNIGEITPIACGAIGK